MSKLLRDGADRAIAYAEAIDERAVAPTPAAVAGLERLFEPLPDEPQDPHRALEILDEVVAPANMAITGRRYFGFVIGGSLPVTVAANWMAGAWDQPTGMYRITPSTAMIEEVALGWLVDVLDLPEGCGAGFVTGATVANFTALAAARHTVLAQAGWDIEGEGMFGAPPVTVVVGAEIHPSARKALGLLGLGRNRVIEVPVDDQGRMRADALPVLSGPAIVLTQAGNVNTGAFDPVGEICDWAHTAGAWVHVDGAFGLWAKASPALRPLVAGVERADSWATDCHKWLNVPYDSGVAFVRDAEALRAAMSITAAYLPTESSWRNPSDFTPELSRRARGIEVWSALRTLGRSGLAEMIDRNCRQARRFAEGLQAAGYEVLNDVVLNQVLVSFGDAETTERVIRGIVDDGTCWCGGTVWQGRTAMRISVSSWATTDEDIERSLDAMLTVCGRLQGTRPR